jgi:hypothetical protein
MYDLRAGRRPLLVDRLQRRGDWRGARVLGSEHGAEAGTGRAITERIRRLQRRGVWLGGRACLGLSARPKRAILNQLRTKHAILRRSILRARRTKAIRAMTCNGRRRPRGAIDVNAMALGEPTPCTDATLLHVSFRETAQHAAIHLQPPAPQPAQRERPKPQLQLSAGRNTSLSKEAALWPFRRHCYNCPCLSRRCAIRAPHTRGRLLAATPPAAAAAALPPPPPSLARRPPLAPALRSPGRTQRHGVSLDTCENTVGCACPGHSSRPALHTWLAHLEDLEGGRAAAARAAAAAAGAAAAGRCRAASRLGWRCARACALYPVPPSQAARATDWRCGGGHGHARARAPARARGPARDSHPHQVRAAAEASLSGLACQGLLRAAAARRGGGHPRGRPGAWARPGRARARALARGPKGRPAAPPTAAHARPVAARARRRWGEGARRRAGWARARAVPAGS